MERKVGSGVEAKAYVGCAWQTAKKAIEVGSTVLGLMELC